MADIGYTERLRRIRDALRVATDLAGYSVDIRPQGVMETADPWVELYLDRVDRDPDSIGRNLAAPYEATIVFVARIVAPGADLLAAMEARDGMVDRFTEAVREQKAAGTYDLAGLTVGNEQFRDYQGESAYFSEALVDLNWLVKA